MKNFEPISYVVFVNLLLFSLLTGCTLTGVDAVSSVDVEVSSYELTIKDVIIPPSSVCPGDNVNIEMDIENTGEMKCEAAHVRRADSSGVAFKANYACVPLCHEHHHLQHQKGESAIGGENFMESQRELLLKQWAWDTLKEKLDVQSMKQGKLNSKWRLRPPFAKMYIENFKLVANFFVQYRQG